MFIVTERALEHAEAESKSHTVIATVQDLKMAEVTALGKEFDINLAALKNARKVQRVFGKLSALHLTTTIIIFTEFHRM